MRISIAKVAIGVGLLALSACASAPEPRRRRESSGRFPLPASTIRVAPGPADGFVEEGLATWYGKQHHGRLTANGERFDMHALTAAHKTLRMQTRVRVTNLDNGRSVVLRINDRGPYGRGRIIDVSYAAAVELDMLSRGVVRARVEVLP